MTNWGDDPKQTGQNKDKCAVFQFHEQPAQMKDKQVVKEELCRSKKNKPQNQNQTQTCNNHRNSRDLVGKLSSLLEESREEALSE